MHSNNKLRRIYMRECRKIVKNTIIPAMKQAAKLGKTGVLFEKEKVSPDYYRGIESLLSPKGYRLTRLVFKRYSTEEEMPTNRYGNFKREVSMYHGWIPLEVHAYWCYVAQEEGEKASACFIQCDLMKEGTD